MSTQSQLPWNDNKVKPLFTKGRPTNFDFKL